MEPPCVPNAVFDVLQAANDEFICRWRPSLSVKFCRYWFGRPTHVCTESPHSWQQILTTADRLFRPGCFLTNCIAETTVNCCSSVEWPPQMASECGIKVYCRFRPLNESEEKAGSKFIAKFPPGSEDCCNVAVSLIFLPFNRPSQTVDSTITTSADFCDQTRYDWLHNSQLISPGLIFFSVSIFSAVKPQNFSKFPSLTCDISRLFGSFSSGIFRLCCWATPRSIDRRSIWHSSAILRLGGARHNPGRSAWAPTGIRKRIRVVFDWNNPSSGMGNRDGWLLLEAELLKPELVIPLTIVVRIRKNKSVQLWEKSI